MAPRRTISGPSPSVTSSPPSSEGEGDGGGGVGVPPQQAEAAPAPVISVAPASLVASPPQAPSGPVDDPRVLDLIASLSALMQQQARQAQLPSDPPAPSAGRTDRRQRRRRRHSPVVPPSELNSSSSSSPAPPSSSASSSSSYSHGPSHRSRSHRSKNKRSRSSRRSDVYLQTMERTLGIGGPTSRPRKSAVFELDRAREGAAAYQRLIHKHTGTPSTPLVQQQSLALLEMEELIFAGATLQILEGRFTDNDAYVLAHTFRTIDYVRESMASSHENPGRGLNTILSTGPQANAKMRDFGPLRSTYTASTSAPRTFQPSHTPAASWSGTPTTTTSTPRSLCVCGGSHFYKDCPTRASWTTEQQQEHKRRQQYAASRRSSSSHAPNGV